MATYREVHHALLRYEMSGSNPPDGRRVIRDERMGIEVAAEAEKCRQSVERAAQRISHPTSAQGQAQIAAINRCLRELPGASALADRIADAQRVLRMWQP